MWHFHCPTLRRNATKLFCGKWFSCVSDPVPGVQCWGKDAWSNGFELQDLFHSTKTHSAKIYGIVYIACYHIVHTNSAVPFAMEPFRCGKNQTPWVMLVVVLIEWPSCFPYRLNVYNRTPAQLIIHPHDMAIGFIFLTFSFWNHYNASASVPGLVFKPISLWGAEHHEEEARRPCLSYDSMTADGFSRSVRPEVFEDKKQNANTLKCSETWCKPWKLTRGQPFVDQLQSEKYWASGQSSGTRMTVQCRLQNEKDAQESAKLEAGSAGWSWIGCYLQQFQQDSDKYLPLPFLCLLTFSDSAKVQRLHEARSLVSHTFICEAHTLSGFQGFHVWKFFNSVGMKEMYRKNQWEF